MHRLSSETSPYLRQHADNPVDWYPWGEEAFAAARHRDVPILLSVGYSACHWCHVMAHESFEDPATAALMNEGFVSIKVDREERPDVDAVYTDAVTAMSGHGGWPMTVFLTPAGEPFFAGTYFPKQRAHGRASFTDVLAAVTEAWRDRRDDLVAQAGDVTRHLREQAGGASPTGAGDGDAALDPEAVLDRAATVLQTWHDPNGGGFGRAPKFPQATALELALRLHGDGHAGMLDVVTRSLDAMAAGGIRDHLGGGFARYSTDGSWLVPHFEKMLYDQAALLRVYLHAHQVTGSERYRHVVEDVAAYVLRDLRHPAGGFCSAEDADSEGEEGRFYVWSLEDVRAVLGPELAPAAEAAWGITTRGNFEGRNIVHLPRQPDGSWDFSSSPALAEARRRLFEHRSTRVRPGLDDKVLTEWNAMWIGALAEAAAALGRDDWLDAARTAAQFLLDELRRPDGRWLRSWHERSGPKLLAYGADHAWLVDAFTRLFEATGDPGWLEPARQTADALLALFRDDDGGGLFTTGDDAERLLVRQKETYDGATPSTNAAAAHALIRLGALVGESRYTSAAGDIVAFLDPALRAQPAAHTHAVAAVHTLVRGVDEIVVSGDPGDDAVRALAAAVHRSHLPTAVLAWGTPFPSPLWEGRTGPAHAGRAFVCRDYTCAAPVTSTDALLTALRAT